MADQLFSKRMDEKRRVQLESLKKEMIDREQFLEKEEERKKLLVEMLRKKEEMRKMSQIESYKRKIEEEQRKAEDIEK